MENKIGARILFSRSYPNFAHLLYQGPKNAQKSFSDVRNTKTMDSASSSNHNESHVSEVSNANPDLLYRFDVDDPWKYFSGGVPVESSVERGRKKTNPKHKRIYISKQRKTFTARRNRAHRDIAQMCLLCTCEQDCLMKGRARETRLMIQQLRQRFFRRNYYEQNYILARQMEVKVCPSGVRKITYNVPSLGKVCRGAFQKCYGISNAKIKVLLKKMDVDGVSIQPDMRGRHEHKTTKLLPEARNMVIADSSPVVSRASQLGERNEARDDGKEERQEERRLVDPESKSWIVSRKVGRGRFPLIFLFQCIRTYRMDSLTKSWCCVAIRKVFSTIRLDFSRWRHR